MTKEINKRNINVDLIRCMAVWSVLSVHFFLNNGFYNQEIIGKRMMIMMMMRTFFMICVPLFLLLTGYLMGKKKLSKKYYNGIIRTVGIYVLASIVCLTYKKIFIAEAVTLKSAVLDIFSFNGASYSWYVEMYIGLFILIPFLNAGWRGLENEKGKKALIITLLICTTLPSILNVWNWNMPRFGIRPNFEEGYHKIVPAWWVLIYPVTYYYLGRYIKEYGFKINKKKSVILLAVSVFVFGGYNCYRNYGNAFTWDILTDYASLQNVLNSVLVFGIILQIPLEKIPMFLKRIIVWVSKNSLGIYLVSEVFDKTFYPILLRKVIFVPDRLEYYIIIVPTCFICSAILSQILSWIFEGLRYIVLETVGKIRYYEARQG